MMSRVAGRPSPKRMESPRAAGAPVRQRGVRGGLGPTLVCAVLTAFSSSSLQAQLTPEDIAALRERGRAEGWTFTVDMTEAAHHPIEQLCGAVEPPDWRTDGEFDLCAPTRDLPSSFDWRDYDGVTPIRNQGGCGSCWGFAAIGTLECLIKIQVDVSSDLSEQWLVSCTDAGDCGGGWHNLAYRYLKCSGWTDPCGNYGAVLESAFPYVASDVPCECPYAHPYCLDRWAYIGPASGVPTVAQIKQAILDYGPVSACLRAGYPAFQAYSGGVFNACEWGGIDHVVVLVGWDDSQGEAGIWFLRNSWGEWWGENGYMRIPYGCSSIGYAACYVSMNPDPALTTTVPLYDEVPSAMIDPNKWSGDDGAEANTLALNEPSPSYSINLDGSYWGGNRIRTAAMDFSQYPDVVIQYAYQRRGGGDSPESGDDLIVEYLNSSGAWVEVARQLGSGSDMTSFYVTSHTVSAAAARHAGLRVQFRVASEQDGLDDWFIDDVFITTSADIAAPTPNPMQWETPPTPVSGTTSQVAMTAAQASDPAGVEYCFDCVGGSCHSIAWQDGRDYMDTGLSANSPFTYVVKARDKSPLHNVTTPSQQVQAITAIQTPTSVTFLDVREEAVDADVPGTFTNLAWYSSGIFLEVTEDGAPAGGGDANTWKHAQSFNVTGLTSGATYAFRAKARNMLGAETPFSTVFYQTTGGGSPCSMLGDMNQDGVVDGDDISGFVRAKLGYAAAPGENQSCANYGGTLEDDIASFIADLTE